MYLIQCTMEGKLSFVPPVLPPGLYERAAGIAIHTPEGSNGSRGISVRKNYALQSAASGSAGPRSGTAPPSSSHLPRNNSWTVPPAEKANSDRYFDTLDSQRKNFLESDVLAPFMLQSKLDSGTLAQIWYVLAVTFCLP
jgi:epidermal growth factor receptor substrate 15